MLYMNRDGASVLNATVAKLLLAAFIVSLATSGFVFAVPFYVLAKLQRADVVGQVVATWTAGYITGCLFAQWFAPRVGPRLLVCTATIGVAFFIFLFRFTSVVPSMLLIGLGYGLLLGLFWAPLMGWLSGDAEGIALSRRLGWFNIAWSSSIIIAPLIAGYLVRQSIQLPFAVMTAIMAAACLTVLATRDGRKQGRASGVTPVQEAAASEPSGHAVGPAALAPAHEAALIGDPFKMRYIRYFAWTGDIVGYLAISVYRYQMPHLAKTLHMDAVIFGRVMVALSVAITVAFFVTARWTGWHGRTRWIFLPQILLVLVSGLLTWATTAWMMTPLMLAAGVCAGMLYTNSVFYGSLGAPPSARTRRMAIHEVCLNIGVIAGSYFGNLLSQHLGPSRVYPYLALVIALSVTLELILWNLLSLRQRLAVPRAAMAAPP